MINIKNSYWQLPVLAIFFSSKSLLNIIFCGAENNITAKQRRLTIEAFIYYLIYSGVRKVFHKIMSTHVL